MMNTRAIPGVRTALLAGGLLALFPRVALAQDSWYSQTASPTSLGTQPWASDRRLGAGDGISTGKFVFHPGVSVDGSYNSNVFLRAKSEDPKDAFLLRPTAFVTFHTQTIPETGAPVTPAYSLAGGASVGYQRYIKAGDSDPKVGDNSNVNLAGNLALLIAPKGKVGGDIHVSGTRSIDPSSVGDSNSTFNRDIVGAGAGIIFRPGGGLFSWKVGYDFSYTAFEDEPYTQLNSQTHTISTSGRWQFRPRTALVFDSGFGFIHYGNAGTVQPDGGFVQSRLGINTLLTKAIAITALGGYATTVYESKANAPKQDFDSFIALATVQFFFTTPPKDTNPGVFPTSFTIGYSRTFSRSFIGNFYQQDRGYGQLAYSFSGKVVGSLQGGVSRLGFPTNYFADGTQRSAAFTNTAVDVGFFIEYRILRNLGINFNGQYNRMISSERLPASRTPITGTTVIPVDDLSWEQYVATLGVRYFF